LKKVRGPSSVAKLPSGGGSPGPCRELQAQVAGEAVGFVDGRPPKPTGNRFVWLRASNVNVVIPIRRLTD
jgi:hypothetical protein